MPVWPKEQLLTHGPDLPIEERIRRYQHNIRTIRASGCAVPAPAMIDSLDPAEIEMWFADSAYRIQRLDQLIKNISNQPDDTLLPSPFIKRED